MEEIKKLVDQAKLSGQPEGAWVSALKIMTQKKSAMQDNKRGTMRSFLQNKKTKRAHKKRTDGIRRKVTKRMGGHRR